MARYEGAHGPLELVWENGHLVLNSANANQSWGSLQLVWERTFDLQKIRERTVRSSLVLGLGGGGIVKLLRTIHPDCMITAVDDDPVMIRIAREHFGVSNDDRTSLVNADAFQFLRNSGDRFDLVLVDLFVDHHVPGELFAVDTLVALGRLLEPGGELMINTMIDRSRADALSRHAEKAGFRVNWCRPLPTNRVMLARVGARPSHRDPSSSDR